MRYNIVSVDEFELTRIELTGMLKNFDVHISSAKNETELEKIIATGKQIVNAIVWTVNAMDMKDFDKIKSIKNEEAFKNIPVLIISKFTDKKYVIKAIEAGAIEYIAKPYNEGTVINKMCRVLGIPFEKAPGNMLDEDILTYNFKEMFNKEIKGASRGGYPFSMMLATVTPEHDGVPKNENEISDLITLFNRVIRTILRDTDTTFHYSDSYLVLLLPFADKEGAKAVDAKIKNIFDTHSVIKLKKDGYTLVTSSASYPDDGKIKDKLLEKLENDFNEILTS